ncbi:hypothetical protein VTK26DRAFT_9263 [Humicola hyalothermophila]
MFWRFGGYANVSTIDSILERDNFELEELLDESDLVQELKQHNARLVEYLRDPQILEKLLKYVVAPKLEPVAAADDDQDEGDEEKGKDVSQPFTPSESLSGQDQSEKKRNRYAFVAAEILSSDNWSLYEALMESKSLLRDFWQFLKRPAPLDPLQGSYFTKVNESLFDKKTEEMLDLLKSMDGAIQDILRHVDSPMIMDLLLKIISLERTESGQGTVEWLYTQDLMPTLISFLGPQHNWATQTSAADFIKAIITVSANASQNEQTCIGPNELTRQLVSKPCVEQLIQYMLGGGNPLTCGVGIVIEVIRKNNSDYDPEGVDIQATPSSRDPIYLGTLLRLFAQHIPDFMNLILNAPAQKQRLSSTFGTRIEPLGFDRFKTCELMAELLHCSNMVLLNEPGSEEFIALRDAQRHRLRAEGRLLPVSVAEAGSQAAEDLSLRVSQMSAADEGRKLEVMNNSADDDGFEEVSHAAEEENSHGVLELPDAPTQPTESSLLDKEDGDFVDEPLSSPRLNSHEIAGSETQQQSGFEDADLVVAPLSPSKKAAQLSEGEKGQTESAAEEPRSKGADQQAQPAGPEQQRQEPKPGCETSPDVSASAPAPPAPASVPPTEGQAPAEPVEDKPPPSAGMPLHPEDTPSPLLSGQGAQTSSQTAPAQVADSATAPTERHSLASQLPETSTSPSAPEPEASTARAAEETSEMSITVGLSDVQDGADKAPTNPKPVVGDYLKMQLVEHRVVPTILGFFFQYPWNNFLHNVVYDIVQQVFNGPMDRGFNPTLAVSLFEDADITNQIINGQHASEKSQAENKTRMGYMGHLTLIAEEVVKFTERHPPELLSEVVLEKVMAQDWINYVEGALAETRERDNAILGGVRPEVAMNNRANQGLMGGFSGLSSIGLGGGGSSALADAGLNGGPDLAEGSGAGGGIGPFAISAGTLMSGFGSSSDEDDDEEQESEEDVNNEFRAYTDPLSNLNHDANSLSPPSIPPPPPPPPPLNIPPSRARLQLAARLAMNKRNAAAAGGGGDGGNGAGTNGDGTSLSLMGGGSDDALSTTAVSLGGFGLPGITASSSSTADTTTTTTTTMGPSTGLRSMRNRRNPFADYEDDDEDDDDDVGSSDEDEDLGGGNGATGGSGGGAVGGWNRGSWWRDVVRGARRGTAAGGGLDDDEEEEDVEVEKFGDGRDDDSSDEDENERRRRRGGDDVDDMMDDEEFGDFAMPEVADAAIRGSSAGSSSTGMVSGIDPAREPILVKPMAVHPTPVKSSVVSPFSSLWPFSGQGFGGGPKDKERKEEKEGEAAAMTTAATMGAAQGDGSSGDGATGPGSGPVSAADTAGAAAITEEPVAVELDKEQEPVVVGEDGKKIDRAVEAKRRTSIEDPDEDDNVVVGREEVVGDRTGGLH